MTDKIRKAPAFDPQGGTDRRYRPSSSRPPFVAGRTGTKRKPKKMPKALRVTAPTHGAGVSGRL